MCAKLGKKQQSVTVLVTLAQEAQHAVSHVCHRHDLISLKFEIYNDENRLEMLLPKMDLCALPGGLPWSRHRQTLWVQRGTGTDFVEVVRYHT